MGCGYCTLHTGGIVWSSCWLVCFTGWARSVKVVGRSWKGLRIEEIVNEKTHSFESLIQSKLSACFFPLIHALLAPPPPPPPQTPRKKNYPYTHKHLPTYLFQSPIISPSIIPLQDPSIFSPSFYFTQNTAHTVRIATSYIPPSYFLLFQYQHQHPHD